MRARARDLALTTVAAGEPFVAAAVLEGLAAVPGSLPGPEDWSGSTGTAGFVASLLERAAASLVGGSSWPLPGTLPWLADMATHLDTHADLRGTAGDLLCMLCTPPHPAARGAGAVLLRRVPSLFELVGVEHPLGLRVAVADALAALAGSSHSFRDELSGHLGQALRQLSNLGGGAAAAEEEEDNGADEADGVGTDGGPSFIFNPLRTLMSFCMAGSGARALIVGQCLPQLVQLLAGQLRGSYDGRKAAAEVVSMLLETPDTSVAVAAELVRCSEGPSSERSPWLGFLQRKAAGAAS